MKKTITMQVRIKILAYIWSKAFRIPTVAGVMSHLIAHVLPEAQLSRIDSNFNEELMNPGHEIAQSLIGNQALKRNAIEVSVTCI